MSFFSFLGFGKMVEEGAKVLEFPQVTRPAPQLKTAEQLQAEAEERKRQEEDTNPVYQIGKTVTGRVTLRLGNAHQFTTITMNNQGVDTLIRLLENAKEAEYDEDTSNPT